MSFSRFLSEGHYSKPFTAKSLLNLQRLGVAGNVKKLLVNLLHTI